MISPFKPFINALIKVRVPGDQLTTDSYGNPVLAERELLIKAYLRGNNSPIEKAQSGIDELKQGLEGYCVEPMILPSIVPYVFEAILILGNTEGRGVFKRQPHTTVEDTTGTKLYCDFHWGAYADI